VNRLNQNKILYFDCSAGVSGDMFAGAMLGLGADQDKLKAALASLNIDDFEIKIYNTNKCGVSATKFDVILKQHEHKHRHLGDINAIIDNSSLSESAKSTAKKIFKIVAEAESEIHGVPADEVKFHEVGAADSIADIVAAAVCLEDIGAQSVICSPLCEGSGQTVCEHGIFPVPAPATVEILRAARIPFKTTDTKGEMITPTGAAIIAGIGGGFGAMPTMAVERIGCGAGTKDFDHPNILRAFLGQNETGGEKDTVEVLETCVDDTTGEALGDCLDALFKSGVRDAYFSPVFMKKGRPAYMLTVLCGKPEIERAAEIIFERTGSIGLRVRTSQRIVMQREIKKVATCYGEIPIKFSHFGGVKKYKAEFEAVEKAAAKFDVTPSAVYSEVAAVVEKIK
jgi:pyridinium-3,5-bisthiocarboxylic acid mononucleotide nickel chelatase